MFFFLQQGSIKLIKRDNKKVKTFIMLEKTTMFVEHQSAYQNDF